MRLKYIKKIILIINNGIMKVYLDLSTIYYTYFYCQKYHLYPILYFYYSSEISPSLFLHLKYHVEHLFEDYIYHFEVINENDSLSSISKSFYDFYIHSFHFPICDIHLTKTIMVISNDTPSTLFLSKILPFLHSFDSTYTIYHTGYLPQITSIPMIKINTEEYHDYLQLKTYIQQSEYCWIENHHDFLSIFSYLCKPHIPICLFEHISDELSLSSYFFTSHFIHSIQNIDSDLDSDSDSDFQNEAQSLETQIETQIQIQNEAQSLEIKTQIEIQNETQSLETQIQNEAQSLEIKTQIEIQNETQSLETQIQNEAQSLETQTQTQSLEMISFFTPILYSQESSSMIPSKKKKKRKKYSSSHFHHTYLIEQNEYSYLTFSYYYPGIKHLLQKIIIYTNPNPDIFYTLFIEKMKKQTYFEVEMIDSPVSQNIPIWNPNVNNLPFYDYEKDFCHFWEIPFYHTEHIDYIVLEESLQYLPKTLHKYKKIVFLSHSFTNPFFEQIKIHHHVMDLSLYRIHLHKINETLLHIFYREVNIIKNAKKILSDYSVETNTLHTNTFLIKIFYEKK
jgi:hypothetical protein